MSFRSILIIDEDRNFAACTAAKLRQKFHVQLAFSREDALEKAQSNGLDLVLLGYLSPRGASFQLHRELREDALTRDIPILVIDVRSEDHLRKGWRKWEGMLMDAEGYISRPVNYHELVEELGRIITNRAIRHIEWRDALDHKVQRLIQQTKSGLQKASA